MLWENVLSKKYRSALRRTVRASLAHKARAQGTCTKLWRGNPKRIAETKTKFLFVFAQIASEINVRNNCIADRATKGRNARSHTQVDAHNAIARALPKNVEDASNLLQTCSKML